MRYPLSATIGLIFAVALTSQAAHASGNVLLPSATSSSSGTSALPNLGLSAPVSTQSGGAESASPQQPESVQPAPTQAQPPSATSPSANRTDLPSTMMQQNGQRQSSDQAAYSLPYRQTIVISDKSMFGTNDVQQIMLKLGLSRDQIVSSCFLGVEGLLQTDKGEYLITTEAAPAPATVSYDGIIKNYLMSAAALCTADPRRIPAASGQMNMSNGRFIVTLDPTTCPPPNRQTTRLTVTYQGNGKSQCSYD